MINTSKFNLFQQCTFGQTEGSKIPYADHYALHRVESRSFGIEGEAIRYFYDQSIIRKNLENMSSCWFWCLSQEEHKRIRYNYIRAKEGIEIIIKLRPEQIHDVTH